MRRRFEPRLPADAAARQEGDAFGAEEPRGSLGRVARVGVLGQEDDQPTVELGVERGKHERKRGLGDACARRAAIRGLDGKALVTRLQLGEECLQTVARGELLRQRVQNGPVHDESRNGQVPGERILRRSGLVPGPARRSSVPSQAPTHPRGFER
jgi:hypothetical protein